MLKRILEIEGGGQMLTCFCKKKCWICKNVFYRRKEIRVPFLTPDNVYLKQNIVFLLEEQNIVLKLVRQ